MPTVRPAADRPRNKLLRSLPPAAYARLDGKVQRTTLRTRQVLYRANQPIDRVYFPEDAVICQMTVMANGDTIETATVGHEGASWVSATIGAPSMPCETIVAVAGTALTLDIRDLDREMRENVHFREVLMQYSHALLIHSMRLTGCTGLHGLEQRCARWLLTTMDRVAGDRIRITHEFLAMLLGVARPTLSLVIEDFKRRGLLRVEQGRILVVDDRAGLMKVTCDCYEIITRNYAQVGR